MTVSTNLYFWPWFYIVVLGIGFFPFIYFSYSIWTFISLLYLDFYVPFLFGFFFQFNFNFSTISVQFQFNFRHFSSISILFLFYRGHIFFSKIPVWKRLTCCAEHRGQWGWWKCLVINSFWCRSLCLHHRVNSVHHLKTLSGKSKFYGESIWAFLNKECQLFLKGVSTEV